MRRSQAKIVVRRKADAKNTHRFPAWMPYVAAISLTVMLMFTVNFRAYTKFNDESLMHKELLEKIEDLNDENLGLQEDIHYLKTDPKKIEREAKKLGLQPRKEKVAELTK